MLSGLAFLLLASHAPAELSTRTQEGDPEDMFAELVLEREYGVDQARQQVASVYGQALATEIAVYWCSPEADVGCEESAVLDAWLDFERLIDDDYSADEARAALEEDYDESLAAALAVFWCSPEPGDGCNGSSVEQAWQQFDDGLEKGYPVNDVLAVLSQQHGRALSEGLAAYACGDLECADAEPEHPEMAQPAPRAEQPTQRSTKKNKYAKKRHSGRPGKR
jgi:hypothetical protein